MLRALLVAAAACVLAGIFGAPAFGARPGPYPHSVTSQHFVVHYTSDPVAPAYATQDDASKLATLADRAYATEVGGGLRPPADDGDGKVDIYIADLSALDGVLAYAAVDNPGVASSAYIVFAVTSLGAEDEG